MKSCANCGKDITRIAILIPTTNEKLTRLCVECSEKIMERELKDD